MIIKLSKDNELHSPLQKAHAEGRVLTLILPTGEELVVVPAIETKEIMSREPKPFIATTAVKRLISWL